MTFSSYASSEFWEPYRRLLADKQFALFQQNPTHPSLRLKAVGPFWNARVSRADRALALRDDDAF